MQAERIVADIARIYAERGHLHYGEGVTEREHALQTGDLAMQAGEPPDLVVASLLHDIGHLLHGMDEDIAEKGVDAGHEEESARVLMEWFGPAVAGPARLHVAAKRYLCRAEPSYLEGLSEASALSLRLQGGPMTAGEVREFEEHPYAQAAVRLRRYDDLAKIPGKRVPDLSFYYPMLRHLAGHWGDLSSRINFS